MKTKHIWMALGALALVGGGIYLYKKNKKATAPKGKNPVNSSTLTDTVRVDDKKIDELKSNILKLKKELETGKWGEKEYVEKQEKISQISKELRKLGYKNVSVKQGESWVTVFEKI